MSFLASQLIPTFVAAVVLTLLAFLLRRIEMLRRSALHRAICILASLLWCASLVALAYVSLIPPATIDVIEDRPENHDSVPIHDDSVPSATITASIQRLREDWNANRPPTWPAAEILAQIANLAYLPPVEAKSSFRNLGFTEFITVNENSMIGYVISGHDVTVIVFRGTNRNEIADWIVNFRYSPMPTPHGRLHGGFYSTYLSMKPQLEKILAERPTTHLWVTGHSLGGALALVCVYDLVSSQNVTINGLMTFGQPRVVDTDLARHLHRQLDGRYACFVNGNDIVPRLPPDNTLCGSLVWFDNGTVIHGPIRIVYTAATHGSVQDNKSLHTTVDADELGLASLNAAEFSELQATLDRSKEPRTLRFDPDVPSEPREYYRASLPQFDDHEMTAYLEQIRSHLGIETSDRSP